MILIAENKLTDGVGAFEKEKMPEFNRPCSTKELIQEKAMALMLPRVTYRRQPNKSYHFFFLSRILINHCLDHESLGANLPLFRSQLDIAGLI